MYSALLDLNYSVITPLISHLGPRYAYRMNKVTGRIGKPFARHPSFVFTQPAGRIGVDTLVNYIGVDPSTAETIVKKIYLLETRCEIEHIWLAGRKRDFLPRIIDMDSIRTMAREITRKGPMLLLSAHTIYYVMILWALSEADKKVAFMMVNPRAVSESYGVLHEHLIKSVDSLSRCIPVLFTNEGNTVNRSIELLKKGYTVMMLLDVPGYRERGIKVKMFNNDFFVPTGCMRIYERSGVPVASVFAYAADIDKPYGLSFLPLAPSSEGINLQDWAGHLESIVSRWPHSWIGWFGLRHMQ
jgi:lauroyl/myristoyl acyltransferase